MDFKQIQELLKLVHKLKLGEVSIKEGEFKIYISQTNSETNFVPMPTNAGLQQQQMQGYLPQAPAWASQPNAATDSESAKASQNKEEESNAITIKSPMIGTFYRSAGPEKPAFISVGDVIKPGDVLCIVEAMKLFNEIESEIGGRIVKVLIDDASPVEYDEPLFLVEPE